MALGLCLIAGCSAPPPPVQVTPIKVSYRQDRVLITLNVPVELQRAEARASDSSPQTQPLRWDFSSGLRSELELWPAPPAGTYEFKLLAATREPIVFQAEIPAPPKPGLEIKLRLPLDVEPLPAGTARPPIRLMAGIPVVVGIDIENHFPNKIEFAVAFHAHDSLEFKPTPDSSTEWSGGAEKDRVTGQWDRKLDANDRIQLRLEITPKTSAVGKEIPITVMLHGDDPLEESYRIRRVIHVVNSDEMLSDLKLLDCPLPVLPTGTPDVNKRADTITLSTPWTQTLKRWLGRPETEEDVPIAHQAVRIANTSEQALAVDVHAEILDASGKPASAFKPPATLQRGDSGFHQTLLLAPKSEQRVVFPVFVQHAALPGTYSRHFTVKPLSFTGVGLEKTEPLHLEQTGGWAFGLTLLSLILTLVGGLIAMVYTPALMKKFARTEWAQIALFGSSTFVLVNAPSQLLAPVIHVLVPVFHPLVLGAYSDTASAAVMAALFVIVPRPGVAFLSGAIRFLLNGLTFGAFAPAAFMYAIPMWLWDECVLYGSGITRGKISAGRMMLASALIGLGGAVLQTALGITLFRLFYADWYLALFFALNGICYPALGGWMGTRLGLNLRKTAE
jgi:hypothetical protein